MHVVDQVIQRFPDNVVVVRRLFLSDAHFRAVCEDYALCIASLRRFEARPDAGLRPEVDDFRRIRVELELELRNHLIVAEKHK